MGKDEAIKFIKEEHIALGLTSYCLFFGNRDIKKLPGIWERKVDNTWSIKVNPHTEDIDNVPALSWYIEYNGWPAGVIGILGDGVMCAGEGGNEENLKVALINSIKIHGSKNNSTQNGKRVY